MTIRRLGLNEIEGSGATVGQVPVWDPDTDQWKPGTVSGGGSGSLTVQDENGTVATGVTQLDFQGAGVTAATGTGEVIVTIPGGGSGSSPSYLGTNSVGGSTENMPLGRMYAKKVTASAAGVLHSVQAYLNQSASASFTMKGLVWSDNAGTPGILLAASHATDVVLGSAGWRAFPLDVEVAASTSYWIGVVASAMPIGSGSMSLAYATGGTDRYQASSTPSQIGDWLSAYSPVTTTNNYSIRGLVASGGSGSSGSSYPPGSADKPPASPNAKDDEFDGTSSVTWSVTPTAPNAWDINTTRASHAYLKASGSAAAYVGKYQAIPVSYPFTITAKVSSTARANYQRGGGIILGPAAPTSTNNLVYLGVLYNAGRSVERITAQFGGTFVSQTAAALPGYWGPVYLKLVATSATSISSYASTDGFNWMPVETGLNPGFTPGVIGLALNDETAGSGCEAWFDFFRVS